MPLLKKLSLFTGKLILIYVLVFAFWILFNPIYNHLLGLTCCQLLSAFSGDLLSVQGVDHEKYPFRCAFTIYATYRNPEIKDGIRPEQYGDPLIVFLALMFITPNILLKRRLKLALIGILILFFSYVFLDLVTILAAINWKYPFVAQSNFMGKTFSIKANYKIAGFILVFGPQFIPVLVWLILSFKYLSDFRRKLRKKKTTGTQRR